MTPHQELTATLATTPVLKASFIGVTGPQGPPGPEGPAGPTGPPGPSGSQTPWTTDVDAAGHNLTNAGKVGIGTAATHPLDVVGDCNITGNYLKNGAPVGISSTGGVNYIAAFTGPNEIGNSMIYEDTISGHIGIGTTTPASALDIRAQTVALRLRGNGADNSIQVQFADKGDALAWSIGNELWPIDGSRTFQFYAHSGTMVMTLAQSGNVGIGTAAPAYPLDVVGDVNCTGQFRISGTPHMMLTQEQYDALLARIAALEAKP